MTYRARQRWPAIAERRRAVVCTRTASGEPCTLVVERDDSGLILSFHGAMRTTAASDPLEAKALIEALRTAAGDRTPPP
ncbi:MAG: hypothetical protein M3O70_19115 [Actinomycetota bacterium]|nr:hypothetical protein [Actinomycetota bacterium]